MFTIHFQCVNEWLLLSANLFSTGIIPLHFTAKHFLNTDKIFSNMQLGFRAGMDTEQAI